MKYDFDSILDRRGHDALAVEMIPIPGAKVADGVSRIPMWVADMSFPTAPAVTEAVRKRLEHPCFGYYMPTDEYWDSIIGWQRRRNGVEDLTRDEIGYENGVLGCLSTVIAAFTMPGESVLFLSPVYVGFQGTMEKTGRRVVRSELVKDSRGIYRMDFADMDRKIKENNIRLAVFCSPHNPCGRVWSREEIRGAMDVFEKNNCIVFSDEIWSDLVLDGHRHIPTQSVSDYAKHHCIACYAPSKTFSLAGLIGSYHIIRDAGLKKIVDDKAAETGYNHMNVLSMHALTGAYSQEGEEWLEELLKVLSRNIHYACDYIAAHFPGVSVTVPEGTYMLFLDCEEYCRNKGRDMDELLRAGIASGVIWQDGRTFGGTHTIRMNLAVPYSMLQDAFDRLDSSVF